MVTSRRSQMSAEFQLVPTTAPGVPVVPKPPGPVFQSVSSKPGFSQPSAGLLATYFHVAACFCDVGTTSITSGGVGSGAQSAALARARLVRLVRIDEGAAGGRHVQVVVDRGNDRLEVGGFVGHRGAPERPIRLAQ